MASFNSVINNLRNHHDAAKPMTWRGFVYRFDAQVFSASKTYAVGDDVVYANVHYRCTTAVTSAGDFNPSNWTRVTADYTYQLIFVEDPEFDSKAASGTIGKDGHPAYRIQVHVDGDGGKTYSDPVSLDRKTSGGTFDEFSDATTPHAFEMDKILFTGFLSDAWETGTKVDYEKLAAGGNRW